VKWNFCHIQSPPPEIKVSQNVVDLSVGEISVLELRDTMLRMGSSAGLIVVAIVMGIPLAGVRVECKYRYLLPDLV
jgi:hypothetical protein